MQNLQLMTDKDRKEAARIERRRALEEERKLRIFNPRNRLFGVDYETLQRQVAEKKQQIEEEKRVQQIFDDQLVKNAQIAAALDQKVKEERIKVQQEINNFRLHYQHPETRREFDLNDPNLIKKQLPARLNDDDPRCGPSSAQKFEGEDLVNDNRAQLQKEQIKSWLEQQMQEKEAAEQDRRAADEAYKIAIIARDQRAIELDNMEKSCRKSLEQASIRFNLALADEKHRKAAATDKQTRDDNLAEIYNSMTSDLLTENPDVGKSNLGPGRQIGYMYKGMTSAEKEAVRKAQLAQIEETKKRKDLEKRMDKEFNEYLDGTQRTISLMDMELERKKREENKKLAEENREMGVQHKNHEIYLKKMVYTNNLSSSFFDQFNKSTR